MDWGGDVIYHRSTTVTLFCHQPGDIPEQMALNRMPLTTAHLEPTATFD